MTFRVHVISDLFYGFNEVTESVDNILPEVDLEILNGNISYIAKRSFLYTYELCSKYPHIQFVYNFGFYERYYGFIDKFEGEGEESLRIRKNQPNWPKNLLGCKEPFLLCLFTDCLSNTELLFTFHLQPLSQVIIVY